MATQVETRLPGNPLAKVEEHGKVVHGEPEEEEGGRGDGARRQTGVGGQGSSSSSSSSSSGGGCLGQGGTPVTESSKQASEEGRGGCDSDDKLDEESARSCNRKDFTEAPPPKVNPWTRKMNAVTVVSVNGQTHHGLYTSIRVLFLSAVTVYVVVSPRPGVLAGDGRREGGHFIARFIQNSRRRVRA